MTRVILRADAGPSIGAGHLIRCIALARALAAHVEPVIATTCTEAALLEHVTAAGLRFVRIDASHPDVRDARQVIDAFAGAQARGVVVDGYHFDAVYLSRFQDAQLRTLVIDDQPRLETYNCDLLLDQNPGAADQAYRARPDSVLLLGPRFALLRPEFLSTPRKAAPVPAVAQRLLVTMGASDPANATSKVLRALAGVPLDFEVAVIVGGANQHADDIESAAGKLGGVRLVRNPLGLERLMSEADLAIAAVGGTMWELAYVGVPTLLLSGSALHHRVAALADREGAHRWIGAIGEIDEQQIADAVVSLARDGLAREQMLRRGQALIDGHGAQRVAAALSWKLDH